MSLAEIINLAAYGPAYTWKYLKRCTRQWHWFVIKCVYNQAIVWLFAVFLPIFS